MTTEIVPRDNSIPALSVGPFTATPVGLVIAGDVEYETLARSRNVVLRISGFDMFSSPFFTESLVCRVGNLQRMSRHSPWDAETEDDPPVRVEI